MNEINQFISTQAIVTNPDIYVELTIYVNGLNRLDRVIAYLRA